MLFDFIIRKMRFLGEQRHTQFKDTAAPTDEQAPQEQTEKRSIPLEENLQNLKYALGNAQDITVQPFRFGPENQFSGALVYIDGMVELNRLADSILRPVKTWNFDAEWLLSEADVLDTLEQDVLYAAGVKIAQTIADLAIGCLSGDTVLLVDGRTAGLVIETKGWEERAVTEAKSESVVRGPREGFTENIRTNISMIRRKIRTGQLKVEQMRIGRKTRTNICMMYLEGVANPNIVATVRYRVGRLDVESILETGYIEEYIEDAPFSPFATVGYTEKPDVAAAKILEGRVAIVVDGTPFVLTAPFLFFENFQSAEDYYNRSVYASLLRMLRFFAFFLAVFMPALYIALVTFQHELVPSTLLFTIIRARKGTPFTAFVEVIIMVFAFEILREAGVRLPRPVGQAISIVGALIMGEAAVSAGLVGAPMVIAIALTAVASFLVSTLNDAISILRIVMIVLAASLGLYGVTFGFLAMLVHLATLESFGVSFLGDFDSEGAQDTLIRAPLWAMTKRPGGIAVGDTTRGQFFIPPLRPHSKSEEGDQP